jgi:hypothetical protein
MPRASILAAMAAASCAAGGPEASREPGQAHRPHLLALSAYEASLGTVIDAYAENLPDADRADLSLVFSGTFRDQDGAESPIDLEVPARRVDAGTVRWTGFGPYGNPFGRMGAEIGAFSGTVALRARIQDGAAIEDEAPIDIRFVVRPSIVVRELEPVTASCSGAIKRAIGGAPYRIRVEAAGFTPTAFTYAFTDPMARGERTAIRHVASGRYDRAGDRGDLVIPPVPQGVDSYSEIITISARDEIGAVHQSAFAVQVHRPLEVFYNGNVQVAEVLAPVPVSGCIPGGESGRNASYNESMEETRSRSYKVDWNQTWLDTHTVSTGAMSTTGVTETNGVGFSTTDGKNWSWSLGGEASASVGLEELVEVGVKVNGSIGGGGMTSMEMSRTREVGIEASTTTTETNESSAQRGGETGGGFEWQVSSNQSISHEFGGDVIAGTYGVFYRQALRLLRRAAIVTYNQCGAASVVADLDFQDWTWSPDLALGSACPPLPASNLPKAQCVVPPCGDQ